MPLQGTVVAPANPFPSGQLHGCVTAVLRRMGPGPLFSGHRLGITERFVFDSEFVVESGGNVAAAVVPVLSISADLVRPPVASPPPR